MNKSKRILVAPLNWGLGHATRCIPIINALLTQGFTPVIASDGDALNLLKKEFPGLEFHELPSYKIKYAKNGKNFKIKLLWDSPKMLKAIQKEKKQTKKLVKEFNIDGIISDNRLGVCYKKVPSVFITHQLNVLTGNTTWMTTKLHQNIIKKFDECWVPDTKKQPNLSGKLGHLKNSKLKIKYLGPLSRFTKTDAPKKYDLMVLLSGPEPQRSMLEEKIFDELIGYNDDVLFVKGIIEEEQKISSLRGNIVVYNYMSSKALERAINESKLVLCRSGYTTLMDLAKLEKKAFFIPTPGQFEQEYLAKRLNKKEIAPTCQQDDFTLELLKKVKDYKGLTKFKSTVDYSSLFEVFSKVKENSDPTSTTLST